MMFHRELLHVSETREMAFRVKLAELLNRLRLEQLAVARVQLVDEFLKRLRELPGWVRGRVVRTRDEVIDIHYVVSIRIDEGEVDRYCIGRTAAFGIAVT